MSQHVVDPNGNISPDGGAPLRVPEAALTNMTNSLGTYALKLTIPLRFIDVDNAPIHLCPGTQHDAITRTWKLKQPGTFALSGEDIGLGMEHLKKHCKTVVVGVGSVGSAFVYDSRLTHWGGENKKNYTRAVLDIGYVSSWTPLQNSNRPLSPEGKEQAQRFNALPISIINNNNDDDDNSSNNNINNVRLSDCTNASIHTLYISARDRRRGKTPSQQLQQQHQQALQLLQVCGFVKIRGAFQRKHIQHIKRSALSLIQQQPASPLLNRLRGSGRTELGLPYRPPFNKRKFINNSLLMPIIRNYLGYDIRGNTTSYNRAQLQGVQLDIVAMLITSGGAVEQTAHTDTPNMLYMNNNNINNLKRAAGRQFHRIHTDLSNGRTTYALNVQVAAVVVTGRNGCLHLCAGSHTAASRSGGGAEVEWAEQHCRIVLGTQPVGGVTIYDSRLIHWGGENEMERQRVVLSLSYSHGWWFDDKRPLTREGYEHAKKFATLDL